MRPFTLGLVFTVAVLFPKVSNAQAYAYGTPVPEITAGTAAWQAGDEPILVDGLVYQSTRAFRIFDPSVMMQSGVYRGVPIYADVTLEPFSLAYVPVARSNMRVYERRRERELAGTAGSRTPSFPVEIASDTVRRHAEREAAFALIGATRTRDTIPESAPAIVGTVGSPDRDRPRSTAMESIPRPTTGEGVWLEFDNQRWYADGPAASFSPDRFEPIGHYRGFPVYREKAGRRNEIWVSVVKDGPVAPYTKR